MSTELDCMLRDEFASNVLDRNGPPGSGDELRQQNQLVYKEVEKGGTLSNLLQVVVGRMPLDISHSTCRSDNVESRDGAPRQTNE